MRVQLPITGTTTHSWYNYPFRVQLPITGTTTHSGYNYQSLVQLPIPGTTTHFRYNYPFRVQLPILDTITNFGYNYPFRVQLPILDTTTHFGYKLPVSSRVQQPASSRVQMTASSRVFVETMRPHKGTALHLVHTRGRNHVETARRPHRGDGITLKQHVHTQGTESDERISLTVGLVSLQTRQWSSSGPTRLHVLHSILGRLQ
jgi:hypothetical protein